MCLHRMRYARQMTIDNRVINTNRNDVLRLLSSDVDIKYLNHSKNSKNGRSLSVNRYWSIVSAQLFKCQTSDRPAETTMSTKHFSGGKCGATSFLDRRTELSVLLLYAFSRFRRTAKGAGLVPLLFYAILSICAKGSAGVECQGHAVSNPVI